VLSKQGKRKLHDTHKELSSLSTILATGFVGTNVGRVICGCAEEILFDRLGAQGIFKGDRRRCPFGKDA
jgi:hypothetical protein